MGGSRNGCRTTAPTCPFPSRRELTGNVQVLLEWFVALGSGRYEVDVPGRRSQRIRRL